MASSPDSRQAAQELVGETLVAVMYFDLAYEDPASIRWDFGDWHRPEEGVQFATLSGRRFYAIWDPQDIDFGLTFAEGEIRERWLPVQDDPSPMRGWDVTAHVNWAPLLNSPITSCSVALVESAPQAIRLATAGGAAWVVAAAPLDEAHAHEDIGPDDVWIGSDGVIALFGDDGAERLGLRVI